MLPKHTEQMSTFSVETPFRTSFAFVCDCDICKSLFLAKVAINQSYIWKCWMLYSINVNVSGKWVISVAKKKNCSSNPTIEMPLTQQKMDMTECWALNIRNSNLWVCLFGTADKNDTMKKSSFFSLFLFHSLNEWCFSRSLADFSATF